MAPPRPRRYALAVSLTLGTSNVAAAIMAVFYTLKLCILIRIVMSWVDPNPMPNWLRKPRRLIPSSDS